MQKNILAFQYDENHRHTIIFVCIQMQSYKYINANKCVLIY